MFSIIFIRCGWEKHIEMITCKSFFRRCLGLRKIDPKNENLCNIITEFDHFFDWQLGGKFLANRKLKPKERNKSICISRFVPFTFLTHKVAGEMVGQIVPIRTYTPQTRSFPTNRKCRLYTEIRFISRLNGCYTFVCRDWSCWPSPFRRNFMLPICYSSNSMVEVRRKNSRRWFSPVLLNFTAQKACKIVLRGCVDDFINS